VSSTVWWRKRLALPYFCEVGSKLSCSTRTLTENKDKLSLLDHLERVSICRSSDEVNEQDCLPEKGVIIQY
jgi:hypothetical protein